MSARGFEVCCTSVRMSAGGASSRNPASSCDQTASKPPPPPDLGLELFDQRDEQRQVRRRRVDVDHTPHREHRCVHGCDATGRRMSDYHRAVQSGALNCRVKDLRDVAGGVRKLRGRVAVAWQVEDEGPTAGVDLLQGVKHRLPGAAVVAQPVQKESGLLGDQCRNLEARCWSGRSRTATGSSHAGHSPPMPTRVQGRLQRTSRPTCTS